MGQYKGLTYVGPDPLPPRLRAVWDAMRGRTVVYNATIEGENVQVVMGAKGGCVINTVFRPS
jgi:hypothetical protein